MFGRVQVKEPDRLQFNIINGVDKEVGGCVYRLYCGKKYIIVKGKTLAGSIFLIEKGYAYAIAFGHQQIEKGKELPYYYAFYKYIKDHPDYLFKIEIILESENPYQLLKREQIELDQMFTDKNCLNANMIAYTPKWISKAYVMNFKKFLKNR